MYNVVVLGSGRSGTSMIAGTLAGAGYFMGDTLLAPDSGNPKGYFEDQGINALNEDILGSVTLHRPRLVGRFLFRDRPLRFQRWLAVVPVSVEVSASPSEERRMRDFVAHEPYCFKDPRFCYTLAAWRPVLRNTRFVCVFRAPAVSAESILRIWRTDPKMRSLAMNDKRAVAVWSAMYARVLDRHSREGEWLFIHYDQFLEPRGVERVARFLDCPVDATFPERGMAKSRGLVDVPESARVLYKRLCERAEFIDDAAVA